jgi:hypothetical protein
MPRVKISRQHAGVSGSTELNAEEYQKLTCEERLAFPRTGRTLHENRIAELEIFEQGLRRTLAGEESIGSCSNGRAGVAVICICHENSKESNEQKERGHART